MIRVLSQKKDAIAMRAYRKRTNRASDKKYTENHREQQITYQKKWVREIKEKVKELLGTSCTKCGKTSTLHLHHKYYAEDSVKPQQHGFNRQFEASKHPERFELLCAFHHKKAHNPVYSMTEAAIKQRAYRAKKKEVDGS